MKLLLLTFLILFSAINLPAQESPQVKMLNISYKDFRINGVTFIATKADIIKHFGKPKSVFEPNYECGFLSEDIQGKKFYSLKYNHVQFTGNENIKYQLEKVDFDSKADLKIFYKGKALTSQTTKAEFQAIFQLEVVGDEAVLHQENADDSLIFRFVSGLLAEMEYWSPC